MPNTLTSLIDRRTLAPRVYEGGGAQRRGEYAAGCYEFASVFGELETLYRMGSPRPSGTPLVNAGGKGAAVYSTNCNLTECYVTE